MDPKKVRAVTDWATPSSVKEVQRFLGFVNFYHKFIKNFSTVAAPLSALTKGKLAGFSWSLEAELSFNELKRCFNSMPILTLPDPEKVCVEVDASDVGVGAVLSQRGEVVREDEAALAEVMSEKNLDRSTWYSHGAGQEVFLGLVDRVWRRVEEDTAVGRTDECASERMAAGGAEEGAAEEGVAAGGAEEGMEDGRAEEGMATRWGGGRSEGSSNVNSGCGCYGVFQWDHSGIFV
ncbi:hypothetical protein QTP86_016119 [Hemibagrus guttatus]|nr:hypothetical protein QTP86_016119 [Hemibagrus guttatus]